MTKVVFYEKPGCGGNARQKALLIASGHELDVRNLLTEAWTAATLRPFFGSKPLRDWFNSSSPRVKSGEIKFSALTGEAALALIIADPLLIRRPLMQVGERREAGFDQAEVDAWIGLWRTDRPVTEACIKQRPMENADLGLRGGAREPGRNPSDAPAITRERRHL
jgi:nitrogenase-associated protein